MVCKFWEAADNSISRVGVFVCASLPRRNRLLSTEESIYLILILVVDMLHVRPNFEPTCFEIHEIPILEHLRITNVVPKMECSQRVLGILKVRYLRI